MSILSPALTLLTASVKPGDAVGEKFKYKEDWGEEYDLRYGVEKMK